MSCLTTGTGGGGEGLAFLALFVLLLGVLDDAWRLKDTGGTGAATSCSLSESDSSDSSCSRVLAADRYWHTAKAAAYRRELILLL